MKKGYKFLEHMADIKFKARGRNLGVVFGNCAKAFGSHVSRESKIKGMKRKKIKITAEDNESLLYSFLDELIYLLDARGFLVLKAKVKVKNFVLEGDVFGVDASRHSGLDYIKAATYSEMYVKKKRNGEWEAQVVLDV
jgi:SHS2 domain-containing protein